jgi:G:T-mismatch repair DNA endonuclease (very short patch repair protein)
VWELLGCFWPGCAKCFARTTQNTVTECSMADLHQRTLDKNNFIADRGYKYISNWDHTTSLSLSLSLSLSVDRSCWRHFNITIKSTVQYFVNTHSGLVSCVKPIYFPTNLTTNFIADRGYKYISNWECDFDRQIGDN